MVKKLLLITGDLATGKSTFANILSKRYDANIFFKDSIKEILGDTIGFSNREENTKLNKLKKIQSNANVGKVYVYLKDKQIYENNVYIKSSSKKNIFKKVFDYLW